MFLLRALSPLLVLLALPGASSACVWGADELPAALNGTLVYRGVRAGNLQLYPGYIIGTGGNHCVRDVTVLSPNAWAVTADEGDSYIAGLNTTCVIFSLTSDSVLAYDRGNKSTSNDPFMVAAAACPNATEYAQIALEVVSIEPFTVESFNDNYFSLVFGCLWAALIGCVLIVLGIKYLKDSGNPKVPLSAVASSGSAPNFSQLASTAVVRVADDTPVK